MLITARFPILDTRPLDGDIGARRIPPFPWQTRRGRFVHGVGPILPRKRGPVGLWSGEGTYCVADRLVRMDSSNALARVAPNGRIHTVDRRLYCHRSYLLSLDVSWQLDDSAGSFKYSDLVAAALAHPVAVHVGGVRTSTNLSKVGKLAGLRLAEATLAEPSAVRVGQPHVAIEDGGGAEILDSSLRRVHDGDLGSLRVYSSSMSGVPVWIIRRSPGQPTRESLRSSRTIRVSLLRIASELESIYLASLSSESYHVSDVASEVSSTLVDTAWRGDSAGRLAAASLAAYREHQPQVLEYLMAGSLTQDEGARLLLAPRATAAEREFVRQDGTRESRTHIRQQYLRTTALDGSPEDPTAPFPAPVVNHFYGEVRQYHTDQRRTTMGDNFENVSESTITNRSTVVNSLNSVSNDPDLQSALQVLVQEVATLQNPEASDLAEAIVVEAAGTKNPHVIGTLWSRLKEIAPPIAAVTVVATKLGELIG